MKKGFETTAEVLKVDTRLGLVFGWAIVCTQGGEDYFDLQGHNIPQDRMLKAAADFMLSDRVACNLHERDEEGRIIKGGDIVFAFPLTDETKAAFGIKCDRTGLMVAMKPDQDMLKKFDSGEYRGFSIGGSIGSEEEVE